jgi:hypothetical protein
MSIQNKWTVAGTYAGCGYGRANFENGDVRMTLHLSPTVDV